MQNFNPFTPLGNICQLTNHYYFGKADYYGNKAYILTKRTRFGFKMYSVNEFESGYIYKSLLHTGKEMTEKLAGDYKYVATKIAVDLMHDLLDIGHTLFIDNWYSSFELSKLLLSHSTDTVGTICADHKDLPAEVKKKKSKNMKKRKNCFIGTRNKCYGYTMER